MREFETGYFEPQLPTNILRNDSRSSSEDSSISVEYDELGITTDFDIDDNDRLVVGVEGLVYGIAPLVQVSYNQGRLADIIVNFNFTHLREKMTDDFINQNPEAFVLEALNKLKTADEDFESSRIWKHYDHELHEEIKRANREMTPNSLEFLTAVTLTTDFLRELGVKEDEIEQDLHLLYRAGFVDQLISESYIRSGTSTDDIGSILLSSLQSLAVEFELELEGGYPDIEGFKFSDFSSDSFFWGRVKGENGEVFKERKIEDVGEKNRSGYGNLIIQDSLIEITQTQDRILLKMRKDGKKFSFSIPLSVDEGIVRSLLKHEYTDPRLILDLVPFKFQVT